MSKKTLYIVIGVFAVIIAGMLVWAFMLEPRGGTGAGDDSGLLDFFPFGRGDGAGERPALPDGAEMPAGDAPGTTVRSGAEFELKQLTTEPVAGATATTSAAGAPAVRYMERPTGNIFDIDVRTLDTRRVTNTTIIAAHEALFDQSGKRVLIRYADDNGVIKTFFGNILEPGEAIPRGETVVNTGAEAESDETQGALDLPAQAGRSTPVGEASGRLAGSFLSDDISIVVLSPERDAFFSLEPVGTQVVGVTMDFESKDREQVFTSPFFDWLPEWRGGRTIALATKASSVAEGFLYALDLETRRLVRLLGDIPGLTANVNTSFDTALYSKSAARSFTLHTVGLSTRESRQLTLATLPEKCAWSTLEPSVAYCGIPGQIPEAAYPDAWYQGIVSFSDTIWKVDTATQTTELLSVPATSARTAIDIEKPFLNESESHLIFVNKKDLTLWSLRLK